MKLRDSICSSLAVLIACVSSQTEERICIRGILQLTFYWAGYSKVRHSVTSPSCVRNSDSEKERERKREREREREREKLVRKHDPTNTKQTGKNKPGTIP